MKQKESNGFAIASLVTSILGFIMFLAPYIAIWFSIAAIVFSAIQKKYGRNGMATAGLVIGIIGIISNLFWLLVVGVLFSAALI